MSYLNPNNDCFYYILTKCLGKIYADTHPGNYPGEFMGGLLVRGNQDFQCRLYVFVLMCVKGGIV